MEKSKRKSRRTIENTQFKRTFESEKGEKKCNTKYSTNLEKDGDKIRENLKEVEVEE